MDNPTITRRILAYKLFSAAGLFLVIVNPGKRDCVVPSLRAILVVILAISASGCKTAMVELGDNIVYNQAHDLDRVGKRSEAFQKFLQVAEDDTYSGSASAQYRVADGYLEGDGTTKNATKAVKWFERVTRSSDITWRRLALYKLGKIYEDGISQGGTPDKTKAAEYYMEAAKLGDDTSQKALRNLERYPSVYVKRHSEEFFDTSHEIAPYGMARAYDLFKSGEHEKAHKIFLFHARRGNVSAQENIFVQYKDGIGVQRDDKLHAAWTYLAARSGSAKAQFHLGLLFRNGDIVPGSDATAIEWFARAAEQGHIEALNSMGTIYANPLDDGRDRDYSKAFIFFRQAADRGSVHAEVNLGDSYLHGLGTEKDRETAKNQYLKAAKKGSMVARQKLLTEFNIAIKSDQVDESLGTSGIKREAKVVERIVEKIIEKPVIQEKVVVIEKPSNGYSEEMSPVELFAKISPSVYTLIALRKEDLVKDKKKKFSSQGSAVSVTSKLALTNCHVIDGMDLLGSKIGDDVVGFNKISGDNETDLCVLHAGATLSPVDRTRSFSDLKVGETVYAIGSPSGLQNTLSEGIISGLRDIEGVKHVQTTTPISPGSSGGGLFDAQGRLVGITTKGISEGSLNFAISVDEISDVLRQKLLN